MTLSGAKGPVGGGDRGLTQDDTYIEVGDYLRRHGVRVPDLYLDARKQGYLLVEDIGSVSLLDCAQDSSRMPEVLLAEAPKDALLDLYASALRFQKRFAELPQDSRVVMYQRRTSAEQRATQIREFLDHYASPRGLNEADSQVVQSCMDAVCARIEHHPTQASHFDFMAANIHVLPSGELCLIDFQDMCMDSPARDVVSLLNDRGSDIALGKDRQRQLLDYYRNEIGGPPDFLQLYDEYLLLWDFRVSGRFALLADKKGVERYRAWIPSTLRRLGRTLVRASKHIPHAEEALSVLARFSPEVDQGRQDPWDHPV
jgi:aminoglycoside/choline kinase family phosphotransferase